MVNPVWGMLAKAQDNPQTIEERIAEMIAQHEEDPEAHMGAGESIENHRINEVVDHPAFSVFDDKLAYDRNTFDSNFQTLSGFDIGDGVEKNGLDSVYFYSANSSSLQYLIGMVSDMTPASVFDYPKNPRFLCEIMVTQITSQEGYILVGYKEETEGFGFKIVNNKLYGFYYDSDGVEQLTEIATLVVGKVYKLEARVDYPNKITFLIDRLVVGTVNSPNIPIENEYGWLFPYVTFKSTTTTAREFYFRLPHWEADL